MTWVAFSMFMAKNRMQHLDHEIHRRVVVVEQQHGVQRRTGDFGLAGFDQHAVLVFVFVSCLGHGAIIRPAAGRDRRLSRRARWTRPGPGVRMRRTPSHRIRHARTPRVLPSSCALTLAPHAAAPDADAAGNADPLVRAQLDAPGLCLRGRCRRRFQGCCSTSSGRPHASWRSCARDRGAYGDADGARNLVARLPRCGRRLPAGRGQPPAGGTATTGKLGGMGASRTTWPCFVVKLPADASGARAGDAIEAAVNARRRDGSALTGDEDEF